MRWLAAKASLPAMRSLIIALFLSTSAAYAQDGAVSQSATVDQPEPVPAEVVFGGPDVVSIETSEGVHEITVELAETPEQLARGLMYRETLDPNAGMLFRYDPPRLASMWMENTLISLDMVYILAIGEVAKVTAYAQPGSRRSLSADFAVAGVLELAGGRALELGIRPGDLVRHRFFDTPQVAGEADTAPDAEETAVAETEDTE